VRDFHKFETELCAGRASISIDAKGEMPHLARGLLEVRWDICTKSGHRVVDGLHSIENADSYKARFFVD
jgi:hypothetical protein